MTDQKEPILLSILICSVLERRHSFLHRILNRLEPQVKDKPVEIIVLSDNVKRSIGVKRNNAIEMAQGKYICFIDDDDLVDRDYVDLILQKINEGNNPDVIVFNSLVTIDGKSPKPTRFGIEYKYDNTKEDAYYRPPNHLMVHRRDNIKEFYNDMKHAEDDEWANRQKEYIKSQERIDKTLYFYENRTDVKKYK